MSDEQVNTGGEQAQQVLAPADVTTNLEAPVETVVSTEQGSTDATANPDPAQAGEATAGDEGEKDEPKKRPTGSDRLKRKLALIETDFEQLARENEELRRRSSSDGGTPQGKAGVDRAPTEQDFPNDYLAFEAARNAWGVRQAIREEINKERSTARDAQLREIRQERLEAYHDNVDQVRTRVPDFDTVVAQASGVNVSPALAEEIMSSDKSALLQYHLAKNPDKVRELNAMNGRELAREIGRLEARVHLPKPATTTKAPPPPTQLNGGATPTVSLANADMDQYVALRRKPAARA